MNLKTKLSLLLPALSLGLALAFGPVALQAQTAPATLRITPAALEIGEGGRRLYFRRYETSKGSDWSQPLRP